MFTGRNTMSYKRILTIQDISCLGQCSGTVALPIISASGHECCIIPSSVLSTHTGGFTGFTFADLTEEIPKIRKHWEEEGLDMDCIYTGYLGSTKQIDYVRAVLASRLRPGGVKVVDPAMADNGTLYYGFDMEFVEAMKGLCAEADYILPNITEASFLTGMEYKTEYDEAYIKELCRALIAAGCGTVVLTGVGYRKGFTGVAVCTKDSYEYYEHESVANGCHGTGDVYASAFVGALISGASPIDAAKTAADYVVICIKGTAGDESHWYGVKFEPQLGRLIEMIGNR